MFPVYLKPDLLCFFSNSKIKILTSLSKFLLLNHNLHLIKYKYFLNHLKIKTKFPRVCNPKPCLQHACSLFCDVMDFIYGLKLFKAINRKYSYAADSLITIALSINCAGRLAYQVQSIYVSCLIEKELSSYTKPFKNV